MDKRDCILLALDYCVAQGTKVYTTDGVLPIEQIRSGMGVLSCINGRELVMRRVEKTACIGYKPTVEIITDDDSSVICTLDHTWQRYNGEMVKTNELEVGDRLAHAKNGFSGKYPTWYVRSHCNYIKKHIAVAEFVNGARPEGYDVDHIDGDRLNWVSSNLRYMEQAKNHAQGGRRYWRKVKNGEADDSCRLKALRKGLKNRRSYEGEGNPNYGKRKGDTVTCPICGGVFYRYPSQVTRKFCSVECYAESRKHNHKVVSIKPRGLVRVYQITVEDTHNYVLANGMVSGNSQIELRVSAHMSQDPTMLDIYWNNGDIHMTTACRMFGLPPEQIEDKVHRRAAKTTNFGALYLISAKGLLAQFQHEGIRGYDERECQSFLDSFRTTYPGFYDWVEEVTAEARRTEMVRDMFGRIRFVPEINSSLKYVREAGIRQAVNAPIQSGAGGVLKEAIRLLWPIVQDYQAMDIVCRPVLQVHDELIFEVEEEFLPIMAPQFHDVMVNAVELTLPVKVDCEAGYNWKELEAYPLEEVA